MNKRQAPWPWSVPLAVQDVPIEGRQFRLEADAPMRAAAAKLAGLPDVARLEADIAAVPQGDGVHLTGKVSATVGQTCVVSLEPMQSEVNEQIDVLYLRHPSEGEAASEESDDEAGTIGDERVETLGNGTIDLGMVAIEFLILGIDPYPRKPDAVFAPPPADDASSSAFAALAALKKTSGRSGG